LRGRPTSLVIYTPAGTRTRLNTAFLYRTADHGADALFGAYFVVEIASDGTWQVDFRNIGQVRKGICPKHQALGVQFVPDYWRQDCQFCYDEDDFYSEVVRTAPLRTGNSTGKPRLTKL